MEKATFVRCVIGGLICLYSARDIRKSVNRSRFDGDNIHVLRTYLSLSELLEQDVFVPYISFAVNLHLF